MGVGDDVDTVIVDGKIVMERGVIPGVDFGKLRRTPRRQASRSGARCRSGTRWDARTRTLAPGAIPWRNSIQ